MASSSKTKESLYVDTTTENRGEKRSLAAKLPRKPSETTPSGHPLSPKIVEISTRTAAKSLDKWFDNGMREMGPDRDELLDDGLGIQGWSALPPGYKGFDKNNMLIRTTHQGARVWVWPLRAELSDEAQDNGEAMTLYHYMPKKSFLNFVKIFAGMDEYGDKWLRRNEFISLIERDQVERHMEPTRDNEDLEPELSMLEPVMWKSKEKLLLDQFNGLELKGNAEDGTPYDTFADYCIAFRVAKSVCNNVPKRFFRDDEDGDTASTRIRVARGEVEEMNRRSSIRAAENEERRKREIEKARKESEQEKAKSCCSRLHNTLFGASRKRPEYWDDVDDGGDDGPGSAKWQKKKGFDSAKEKASKDWLKEHFVRVVENRSGSAFSLDEAPTSPKSPASPTSPKSMTDALMQIETVRTVRAAVFGKEEEEVDMDHLRMISQYQMKEYRGEGKASDWRLKTSRRERVVCAQNDTVAKKAGARASTPQRDIMF